MLNPKTCIAAIALALTASAHAVKATPASLTAGIFIPPQAALAAPYARWIDHVNTQCSEHVSINLLGPEAISAFEQPNALKTGVIDMLGTPGTYYKGDMIEIDSLVLSDMPLDRQREVGVHEMLNTLHHERMNAEYLTSYGTGVKFFIWTDGAHEDGAFSGVRLRSSPIYETFFQSLQATTVQLPPSEVYTALERGTVDGVGWPSWGLSDFGWEEKVTHQHGPGFYNVMISMLVNKDRWDGLTEEARNCLDDQAQWMEKVWPEWLAEGNATQETKIKEAGIIHVDLGADFTKSANEIYWSFLTERSPENTPRIRALLESDAN